MSTAKTRAQLKALWITGFTPSESTPYTDMQDFIDSFVSVLDDAKSYSKNVLYTDLNGGISPQTTLDIALPNLAKDEIITAAFVEINSLFIDSGINNDLAVALVDLLNNQQIGTNRLIDIATIDAFDASNLDITFTILPAAVGMKNIHTATSRTMVLRCTATDLTLLTAGEFTIYYKTEKIS